MTRILLIHTGGTICMAPGPDGLAPKEGVVEAALDQIAARQARAVAVELARVGPLMDSAEIGPAQWNAILDAVSRFDGQGVIVTHGTDTMAYTGAALAEALRGTPHPPVVLAGAMHPLGHPGSDAEANLEQALVAILDGVAGVTLAFAGRRLDGGALVKHHSQADDAFRATPQAGHVPVPPVRRYDPARKLAILTLTPGLPVAAPVLAALLAGLDGAVLRVFGTGTAMSDAGFLATLAGAVARGCPILAVSQCEAGGVVPGTYAAGAGLWATGVEPAGTATPEAALCRLWLRLSA